MMVLVIGQNGIGLMPTTPRKARLLLRNGKATVYRKQPFTIKLNYKTGSATQPLRCGVDTGEQHIGIAVVRGNTVLDRTDIELRKSMEKRTAIQLRMTLRRGRRYRKTRYRHPKFRFQTKRIYAYDSKKKCFRWMKVPNTVLSSRPKGWLPPSLQSKVDHHTRWILRYQEALPPDTVFRIEVAKFDVARMKDSSIYGEQYQQGRMYDFENVKSYVLAKFNYTCPICQHKFDNDHKARMHHVHFKSKGATDNPDEYAPICEKCHTPENHKDEGVLAKLRIACQTKTYKEPVFMNILRLRLFKALNGMEFTYGNFTSADRKVLGLEKSHANDAVAIAVGDTQSDVVLNKNVTYYKQVRKKKRSLHEVNPRKGRVTKNVTAKRNHKNVKSVKGYNLYDKVITKDNQTGYITGFTGSSAYITDFNGKYILPKGKTYKQHNLSGIRKCHSNNNWLVKTAAG